MINVNKPEIGRYIKQKEGFETFTPFDFPPQGGFVVSPELYKNTKKPSGWWANSMVLRVFYRIKISLFPCLWLRMPLIQAK